MVATDLRVQAAVHADGLRLLNYRADDHEVDVVVEAYDGRVAGVEIKRTTNSDDRMLPGLRRLRRDVGERCAGGIVLCSVPVGRTTEDGLAIVPIDAVWHG